MKSPILLSLALGCGWLFSPEVLVITGNSAGNLGLLAIPLLALAAFLFSTCGKTINSVQLESERNNELQILQQSIGAIPAASLTLAACFPLLILAATALLVTSGYTFNEVFLYWFPNFGFAFLLLGLLTLVQFLPMKLLLRVQLFCVSLAGGGILILALYGSGTSVIPLSALLHMPESLSQAAFSSTMLLFLFVGSNLFHGQQGRCSLVPRLAFFVFALWMFASLSHVNPERLASSTIPYMTASRRILGDTGRQIMGVVVISGSCAAVIGLTLLCREKLTDLVQALMAPGFLAKGDGRWVLPPLVAIATGICMATGLAGDEILETLLRSALLLWLLYYSAVSLAAIRVLKKAQQTVSLPARIAPLLLFAGLLAVLLTNPQRSEMFVIILCLLVTSSALAALWFFINPKKRLKKETL